jgi:hypothetical protein
VEGQKGASNRGETIEVAIAWGNDMKTVANLIVLAVLGLGSTGVYAAPQAQDWDKKEEPALRPYKAMWRGVKAIGYHAVRSFAEGNEKAPVVGSIEVFRGLRRGAVECVTSTWMGMAGSRPDNYRKLSKPNAVIENDILLRNAADVAATAAVFAIGGETASAVKSAGVLWVGQKAVDHSPLIPASDEERPQSRTKQAQERYIGKRAHTNEKASGTGNLLKLAK